MSPEDRVDARRGAVGRCEALFQEYTMPVAKKLLLRWHDAAVAGYKRSLRKRDRDRSELMGIIVGVIKQYRGIVEHYPQRLPKQRRDKGSAFLDDFICSHPPPGPKYLVKDD